MSEFDLDKILPPRLRVMRIILLALVTGCLIFLGITVGIRLSKDPRILANDTAPLLTYMGIGMGLLMLVLHFLFPRLVVANSRKQIARAVWNPAGPNHPLTEEQRRGMSDVALLLSLYQSQMIIGLALLEGAAFFNLIAFLQEGDPASVVMAAILLVVMLGHFPTRHRLENFLLAHGELLRQARQAG